MQANLKKNMQNMSRLNISDRGTIPIVKMAVITVEQLVQCLKAGGLANVATLLKTECASKKVIQRNIYEYLF